MSIDNLWTAGGIVVAACCMQVSTVHAQARVNLVSNRASDSIAQGITRVTGVELNQTNDGLEVIFQTAPGGKGLAPLILPQGNSLVIDILDASLGFSIRNGIEETNPAPGISAIALNEIDDNSIRPTITGENQVPSAEVVPGDDLVLSVTPEGTTATREPAKVGARRAASPLISNGSKFSKVPARYYMVRVRQEE